VLCRSKKAAGREQYAWNREFEGGHSAREPYPRNEVTLEAAELWLGTVESDAMSFQMGMTLRKDIPLKVMNPPSLEFADGLREMRTRGA
jgi:hypothetical protein